MTLRFSHRQALAVAPTRRRSEEGWAMVEALIACTILLICLAGLMQDLMRVLQLANKDQFQTTAAIVAQEALDYTRTWDYVTLNNQPKGTEIGLLLNRDTTGQMGPSFCPQPLLLDKSTGQPANSASWSSKALNCNLPSGTTVTEQFEQGPGGADTLRVTVFVTWPTADPAKPAARLDLSTIISRHGIHEQ